MVTRQGAFMKGRLLTSEIKVPPRVGTDDSSLACLLRREFWYFSRLLERK